MNHARSILPESSLGHYSALDNAISTPAITGTQTSVRVWDLPTRVLHWGLLVCMTGAIASAYAGGNWMTWHLRFGAAMLGLLVFRIVWGFVGPRYARFSSFLYGPKAVFAYFRTMGNHGEHHAGHTPAGALSVFAMLGTLGAQTVSGLFSSDSISTEGPLAHLASEAWVSLATSTHATLQWVIYGFVALHVTAILAYLVAKKIDLIRPMIHGDKPGLQTPHAADTLSVRIIGLSLMSGAVWGAVQLFGG